MTRRYQLPSQAGASVSAQYTATPPTALDTSNPYAASAFVQTSTRVQPQIPWNNEAILSPPPPPGFPERPPYFRTTVNQFPANKSVLDNLGVPVSVIVSPAQVTNVPVIDMHADRLSRCPNCHSYLSPFHKLLPDNTVTCPFCGSSMRVDNTRFPVPQQRPELQVPVYDMIAPLAFTNMPNSGPSFVLVFDMTADAIASGFTLQMITSVRSTLASVQDDTFIAVITMGTSVSILDFTTFSETSIPDLTDIFVPRGCRAKLGDVREMLDSYLESLLSQPGVPGNNCLMSAYQTAIEAMQGCGGVIVAGCFGIASNGPMAVHSRKMGQGVQEADLLKMAKEESSSMIVKLSRTLNREGFSVHLFACKRPGEELEFGTVTVPCGLTGGNCHLYTKFEQSEMLDLHNDLFRTLTQDYLWDSSMRLRASHNIAIRNATGNLILSQETVFFPIMQGQSTVTFDLDINGDLNPAGALLQLAVLWTNSNRQRMIRIFSFMLPLCSDVRTLSAGIDEAAIATMIVKYSAISLLRGGPVEAVSDIKKRISIMASRGNSFVSLQYILHSLLCSNIIRVPIENGADRRMATIIGIRACNVIETLLKLYPRFFTLENPTKILPLSNNSFAEGTVFVVQTHKRIYVWVSPAATQETLQGLFGVSDMSEVPTSLPQIDTPLNASLNQILTECYTLSGRYLPTEIIPAGSPREAIFSDILVDENNYCGAKVDQFIANFR